MVLGRDQPVYFQQEGKNEIIHENLAQEPSQSNHLSSEPPFLCEEALLAKRARWLNRREWYWYFFFCLSTKLSLLTTNFNKTIS